MYKCDFDGDGIYETECEAEQWCNDSSLPHIIDWDSDYSLYNWVERLDMACVSWNKIGLLGSMYFVGWVISLIIISRLADKMGRRVLFLGSLVAQCITFVAVIFCTSLNLMIALMFISGLITGIRMSLGYVYMMEFCAESNQTVVGTVHLIIECMIALGASFYFQVISKHWVWFVVFGLVGELFGLVMTILYIPESPKFLLMQCRFTEARHVLNQVAKRNRIGKNFMLSDEDFSVFSDNTIV